LATRDYIEAVRSRVVVFDGGMGATLEQFDLTQDDYGGLPGKCHEALVLNRPDVIEGVHESMLNAGAQVVETDTFQASRLKLDEWGLGEHTPEINRRAAEIARKAAGEERFVAGSIGPTGHLPASDDPTLGKITFRELVEVFTEQAQGLIEGGADLLIIETAQDILEVKAAIFGAREAFKLTGREVPLQTSVSLLPNGGKMLLGTDIQAVLTTLTALDVDVIGLNCSTGPEDMRDAIRYLGENSPVPVHCIPNAGLPLQGPDGETIFPEQPDPLANVLQEFVERIAGTRGRGRAEHFDLDVRQRLVDVRPVLVRIRDQLAVRTRHFLGNRHQQLRQGQLERRALLRLRNGKAVKADIDLDDVLDAVLLAHFQFALLHAARGIGRVRMLDADAGAEQLHAAAGAGGFHHRGLDATGLAELLGTSGGERINGRRADDADLVAGFSGAGQQHAGRHERECASEGLVFQGLSPSLHAGRMRGQSLGGYPSGHPAH
jgi:methionine synthase I (cobalamin-dependent)